MKLLSVLTLVLVASACGGSDSGGGGSAGAPAEPTDCPPSSPLWYEEEQRCVECISWQDCESQTCAGGTCIAKCHDSTEVDVNNPCECGWTYCGNGVCLEPGKSCE